MLTIIVVDDHQIFRESLSELLTKQGYKVLANAANGALFLPLLEVHRPDLVIMDIDMPQLDGYDAAKIALAKYPDLRILTLSSYGDEKYYYKMVEAGVKGFVLKNAGINELRQAIMEITAGGSWFSSDLLKKVVVSMGRNTFDDGNLNFTNRELEVLNLICSGLTLEKIAEQLKLALDVVSNHRASLLSKTGCSNAPALVMYAIKNKLIEI